MYQKIFSDYPIYLFPVVSQGWKRKNFQRGQWGELWGGFGLCGLFVFLFGVWEGVCVLGFFGLFFLKVCVEGGGKEKY